MQFLITIIVVVIFSSSSFSQLIISPYIGNPNTLKTTNIKRNPNFKSEVINEPIDEKTSKIGTLGLRIEKIKKSGFSFDLNYTSCDYSLIYDVVNYNSNVTILHVMEVSSSIFRFLLNYHSHFSNSIKSDPYMVFGIGGRVPIESYYSTNPDFTYTKGHYWDESGNETFVSWRFGLGYNYYFSKNFGIMLEAGLFGGGFIRTGFNIRFL